jgi:hypothetical protein
VFSNLLFLDIYEVDYFLCLTIIEKENIEIMVYRYRVLG